MSCLFCVNSDDLAKVGSVIYEDQRCAALLHDDWSGRGHAMLVWKRHVENVSDLDDGELRHFASVHARLERVLLDETGAERAVLLKLGIQAPHLHLHIYPVSSKLDRTGVMEMIDAKRGEPRDEAFVEAVRESLSLTRDPS